MKGFLITLIALNGVALLARAFLLSVQTYPYERTQKAGTEVIGMIEAFCWILWASWLLASLPKT